MWMVWTLSDRAAGFLPFAAGRGAAGDVSLSTGTIRENVAFARPSAKAKRKFSHACRIARVDEVRQENFEIAAKYDTVDR